MSSGKNALFPGLIGLRKSIGITVNSVKNVCSEGDSLLKTEYITRLGPQKTDKNDKVKNI